mmetsp:Transcript_16559/g.24909  ORF Transcript_16559/g.24909 Transcript_16559/m.24909 type:complete len:115 (-) Transcript_16559:215-559(-)
MKRSLSFADLSNLCDKSDNVAPNVRKSKSCNAATGENMLISDFPIDILEDELDEFEKDSDSGNKMSSVEERTMFAHNGRPAFTTKDLSVLLSHMSTSETTQPSPLEFGVWCRSD